MTDDESRRQALTTVQARWEPRLMRLPNVIGVGIGEQGDLPALMVFVRRKLARDQLAPEDLIPSEIEGFAVAVEEVGEITAPIDHEDKI